MYFISFPLFQFIINLTNISAVNIGRHQYQWILKFSLFLFLFFFHLTVRCVVYVCPPLIYTKAVALIHGADSTASKRAQVNLALVPFGLFIAVLGCFMTIKEAKLK